MDAEIRQLIARLHQSSCRCVLAATGGGAGAIAWLLSIPGGSRTVLEASVPYSEESLKEYLGHPADSSCSLAVSQEMAVRAQQQARRLAPGAATAGIGCTASLASDRPKGGDHRFHLSVHDGVRTTTYSLTLAKGGRDRQGEEYVVDVVFLNALAEAFGVPDRIGVPLLPGEQIVVATKNENEALARFLAGQTAALYVEMDGRTRSDAPRPALLLAGAFNPIHEGHLQLAEIAAEIVGAPAAFDLSVLNADKPPLLDEEVRRRLIQFVWRAPVWLTRAATYTEKAELFPGCAFVVGADTAARIVHPRFYGDSEEQMALALGRFRAANCRFLAAGRIGKDGRFVGLDDLAVPQAYRDLFQSIPEAAFRLDLSSTELRARTPFHLDDAGAGSSDRSR